MELVIGTKKWSTWSMRPWLVLKKTGADFTEQLVELRQGDRTAAAIAPLSPSGHVPALKDGDLVIWDSLAICEYLAEKFPQAQLWPADPGARALANYFVLPTYTLRNERIARWDRFSHPDPLPEFSVGFPEVWWYDEAKAAKTGVAQ